MILTDEQVEERLTSPDNLMNKVSEMKESHLIVLPKKDGSRGEVIPSRVRQLLGVIANKSTETQTEVADAFDVTQASVSMFSRGISDQRVDHEIKEVVDKARESKAKESQDKESEAHELALDLMVDCIKGVSGRLHEVDKPKELAKMAVDMSKIVGNLKDKDKAGDTNNTQVIIYAPNQRSESAYETLSA